MFEREVLQPTARTSAIIRRSQVPRGVRRFSLLSGVALCAGLGGAIAVAQASDNTLKQTLNSFAPKIVKDESAVTNGLEEYPKGKVMPLTRALQHEVGDLRTLKSRVSHESASTASGATAKKEIIQGLGLIASAYGTLRDDVLAAGGGPVPAAQVTAAVNTDKKGRKKLLAGLNLLGAQSTPSPTPTTPTPTTPTPTTPAPTPTGCYPLTSTGKCYEPGEYCSNADHGMSGVAGDGESIICENNNGWRWEPQ
jgi:hypothetical protein